MPEVEQKIKITTEFVDNSQAGYAKAKAQLLDFAKAAEKAGKDISKAMGEGTKEADQKSKGLLSTFAGLKTATLGYIAVATAAAASIYGIVKVINDGEEATKKFTFALKNSGIESQLGVTKFKAFASSIQETTKYSDGAIVSLGTFFTKAGIGYNKLETATRAAVEYSAAFGTTLEQAGDAVAASFNGQARELGKFIPEIKRLTDEQLRAGEAADILIKKFGGSAKEDRTTFSGALEAAKNSVMSLIELLQVVLGPVLKYISHELEVFTETNRKLVDLFERITGKKKELNAALSDPKAITALNKEVAAQKNVLKAAQDLDKWKEAHKDDQKTFNDLKKQADAEKGSATDQIMTEYQQRVDAIKKLTGVEKTLREQLIKEEYDLRDKKIQDQNAKDKKILDDKFNNDVQQIGSSFASGNASGVASGGASILGVSAGAAGAAALLTELVVNSKDIPKKLDEMISGLAEGFAKGVPALISYLAGPFISDFISKVIPALVQGIIKVIPLLATAMFRITVASFQGLLGAVKGISKEFLDGAVTVFTGGLNKVFGGLFGDGPSPQELLTQVMEQLKDSIKELNKSLNQSYRQLVSSVSSPDRQLSIAKGDLTALNRERSDLSRQAREAAMAGDAEKTDKLLKELAAKQSDMLAKSKDIYDLERDRVQKIYDKKKELYDKERGLIVDRISELTNLRNSATDSINKAREAILVSSATDFQNVDRLRQNYRNATDAKSKSDAASALAGGLQSEFESAKNLSSQGAISGEEFARIKQGILSELNSTQGQITSEFQQLIAAQEKQISTLDAGFKRVTDTYSKEMAKLRDALLELAKSLKALPKYAQGTNYVPNTGLAMLHQGEQVIPKGQNAGATVVFNVNGVPTGTNNQELTKAILNILKTNQGNFRGAIGKV